MSEPELLVSVVDHVATITLNRPKKGNSLTPAMNSQILEVLPKLAADPDVRVLVLTGAGRFFCTGMDLSTAGAGSSEDGKTRFAKGNLVFDAFYSFPKPVIARVNGPAIGGGLGLVFTADIRVASDNVYFALSEIKRGIIPAIISQYIVPEVGSQKAREYMLTGRRIEAANEGKGFLSAVVPPAELDNKVKEYVAMLIDSAPSAMTDVKQLVNAIGHGGDDQRRDRIRAYVEGAFIKMMQSDEASYGIAAFMAKQKPDWNAFLKDKANSKL